MRLMHALVALLLVVATDVCARDQFVSGNWRGAAYPKQGGRFTHCVMHASYVSGTYLMFRIDRNGNLAMGLANVSWSLTPGARYALTYSIDYGPKHTGTAVAQTKHGVWIKLPSTRWMLNRLRVGKGLRIRSVGTSFAFRLTGTYVALERLFECTKTELALERGYNRNPFVGTRSRNPFASTKSENAAELARLKATTIIANLFNRAGLSQFTILAPDKKPPALANYDVVWKGPGIIGGLRIVGPESGLPADKITALLITQDAGACKGRFTSGIKADKGENAEGSVRFFTACAAATSWRSLYSVYPMSKGGFVIIGQVAQAKNQQLQTIDDRMFESLPAVLRE
jgi:hypothetical protein